MIYCDTSVLLALYVDADFFHPYARKIAAKLTNPIPYPLLTELELLNGLRRLAGAKSISEAECTRIIHQIDRDLADGILARVPLDQGALFKRAGALSKKHTTELLSRSLDILHVAAAAVLEAEGFASFDSRQRTLAQRTGIRLLPDRMPQRA